MLDARHWTEDVDLDGTAQRYALSGGAIANVIRHAALASLRRNISRSMVTVDELIGEIRRLRRRSEIVERAQQEGINTEEVERHRREMRNAILLAPGEVRGRLVKANFEFRSTKYTMFVPPRFRWIERCERLIDWIPLGGQYAVTARKPR